MALTAKAPGRPPRWVNIRKNKVWTPAKITEQIQNGGPKDATLLGFAERRGDGTDRHLPPRQALAAPPSAPAAPPPTAPARLSDQRPSLQRLASAERNANFPSRHCDMPHTMFASVQEAIMQWTRFALIVFGTGS